MAISRSSMSRESAMNARNRSFAAPEMHTVLANQYDMLHSTNMNNQGRMLEHFIREHVRAQQRQGGTQAHVPTFNMAHQDDYELGHATSEEDASTT